MTTQAQHHRFIRFFVGKVKIGNLKSIHGKDAQGELVHKNVFIFFFIGNINIFESSW